MRNPRPGFAVESGLCDTLGFINDFCSKVAASVARDADEGDAGFERTFAGMAKVARLGDSMALTAAGRSPRGDDLGVGRFRGDLGFCHESE